MVDSDLDMRDTMSRVIGPWEAELENERRASLVAWNLSPALHKEALPSTDIEVKLRKLTTITYD